MLRQLNRSFLRGRICGTPHSGVLGSLIPSTGLNGPSYLYNDLSLPADAGKEYSGEIQTFPASGALFAYEDGSFTYTGTPSTFTYQLRENGIALGEPVIVYVGGFATFDITLGSLSVASTGAAVRSADVSVELGALTVAAAALRGYQEGAVNVTLDGLTLTATGARDRVAELSKTLDDLAVASTATIAAGTGVVAEAGITFDGLTVASVAQRVVSAAAAITLGDVTLASASHYGPATIGDIAFTLADLTTSGQGTLTDNTVLAAIADLSAQVEALSLQVAGIINMGGNGVAASSAPTTNRYRPIRSHLSVTDGEDVVAAYAASEVAASPVVARSVISDANDAVSAQVITRLQLLRGRIRA